MKYVLISILIVLSIASLDRAMKSDKFKLVVLSVVSIIFMGLAIVMYGGTL
jgi:hypothetical protein